MKAGTTSLYRYLRGHPQEFMPDTKERNFFSPLRNWRRGVEWYEQQFEPATHDALAIGERATSYPKFPWIRHVPSRIASGLGDIRLVYVLRHPIERMQSHYIHSLATGQEWRPAEVAFLKDPMYLNISRYALQIEQYTEYFSRDHLLIVESRDLRQYRPASLCRVSSFLGVDEEWIPPTIEREFYRSPERRMKPALLRRIRRIPRLRTMAVYLPGSVRSLKHRLTKDLPTEDLDLSRASVSEKLMEHLRKTLREDLARLRPYMAEEFDCWDSDDMGLAKGAFGMTRGWAVCGPQAKRPTPPIRTSLANETPFPLRLYRALETRGN